MSIIEKCVTEKMFLAENSEARNTGKNCLNMTFQLETSNLRINVQQQSKEKSSQISSWNVRQVSWKICCLRDIIGCGKFSLPVTINSVNIHHL